MRARPDKFVEIQFWGAETLAKIARHMRERIARNHAAAIDVRHGQRRRRAAGLRWTSLYWLSANKIHTYSFYSIARA
jgi:hypothetical protein